MAKLESNSFDLPIPVSLSGSKKRLEIERVTAPGYTNRSVCDVEVLDADIDDEITALNFLRWKVHRVWKTFMRN